MASVERQLTPAEAKEVLRVLRGGRVAASHDIARNLRRWSARRSAERKLLAIVERGRVAD